MFEALTVTGRNHRVVLTSQSVGAIQSAVENGLGVALLTAECIRPSTMRVLTPSVLDRHIVPAQRRSCKPLFFQFFWARARRDHRLLA
jgi:DNA-binding transcriptional LysR family regulator